MRFTDARVTVMSLDTYIRTVRDMIYVAARFCTRVRTHTCPLHFSLIFAGYMRLFCVCRAARMSLSYRPAFIFLVS